MSLLFVCYEGFPRQMKAGMDLLVVLEAAEDDWIVAECPALPGCISQGRDEREATKNIGEAISAWLWAEDQKQD